MFKVDINADVGESFGRFRIGKDDKIIPMITSANIACGFHSGDPITMNDAVRLAVKNNVNIGAHPGFRDLNGFGRRKIIMDPKTLKLEIQYQLGALSVLAQKHGSKVTHLKPHGALYTMAAKDTVYAKAIVDSILEVDKSIRLFAQSQSKLAEIGKEEGLTVIHEVFADRAYNNDGSLVSREKQGAVLHDLEEIVKRSIMMIKNQKVQSYTGDMIDLTCDTICIHGDEPQSLELITLMKKAFINEDILVKGY